MSEEFPNLSPISLLSNWLPQRSWEQITGRGAILVVEDKEREVGRWVTGCRCARQKLDNYYSRRNRKRAELLLSVTWIVAWAAFACYFAVLIVPMVFAVLLGVIVSLFVLRSMNRLRSNGIVTMESDFQDSRARYLADLADRIDAWNEAIFEENALRLRLRSGAMPVTPEVRSHLMATVRRWQALQRDIDYARELVDRPMRIGRCRTKLPLHPDELAKRFAASHSASTGAEGRLFVSLERPGASQEVQASSDIERPRPTRRRVLE